MSELLKLEIQTICIVHIVAIIISTLFLVVFYYKAYNEKSINAFIIVQLSMIFWMIFKICKTVSPTLGIRWSFIVAYYICTCILEVSFLEFSYTYNTDKFLSKRIRTIIYSVAGLQAVFVITNPLHHMFYKTFNFYHDSFGNLFYLHSLIEYIIIGIGFVYCYKTFNRRFKNKSSIAKVFTSFAILFPLVINFLYITKTLHKIFHMANIPVIFDVTPIVFTTSLLIFVYATFHNSFFDISPLLRHEIAMKLNTPVIVLDSGLNNVFSNEKAVEISNKNIEKLVIEIKEMIREERYSFSTLFYGKTLKINIKKINDLEETQYIILFHDISSYYNLEKELVESQKKLNESNEELNIVILELQELSKEGARSYVARELHDVVGHSLVVSIKLLEVASLYYYKDKFQALQSINDAKLCLEEGIVKMGNLKYNEGKKDIFTGRTFKKQIEKILKYVREIGISTNLVVKGESYNIDGRYYDDLITIISELVTNTLKYASASEILVTASLRDRGIEVIVMDNGIGKEKLVKGNGLNGINRRIFEIGGSVKYITSKDNGFTTIIKI